jgi:hypothetical protein
MGIKERIMTFKLNIFEKAFLILAMVDLVLCSSDIFLGIDIISVLKSIAV